MDRIIYEFFVPPKTGQILLNALYGNQDVYVKTYVLTICMKFYENVLVAPKSGYPVNDGLYFCEMYAKFFNFRNPSRLLRRRADDATDNSHSIHSHATEQYSTVLYHITITGWLCSTCSFAVTVPISLFLSLKQWIASFPAIPCVPFALRLAVCREWARISTSSLILLRA